MVPENCKAVILGVHPIDAQEPVHLVELYIGDLSGKFECDGAEITQYAPDLPRGRWQVPWLLHVLNKEGTAGEEFGPNYVVDVEGEIRLAFFFHYLDLSRPLTTPLGDLDLPPVSPCPQRLRFMEYSPVD